MMTTKPTIRTLLAAMVIGGAGSFAVAQQDPQLQVQRQGEDRAVVTLQDGSDKQAETMQDQTVRGTLVSLETYLRDGGSAAKEESASSAGTERPMALLSDDGELYLILDKPMSSSARSAQMESDRDAAGSGTMGYADPDRDESGNLNQATDSRVGGPNPAEPATGDVNVGTSSERNARAPLNVDSDKDAADLNMSTDSRVGGSNPEDVNVGTTSERNARAPLGVDSDKTGGATAEARTDADADAQVYGMADGEAKKMKYGHAGKLKVGEQVTLVGDVYQRDGIKGIAIDEVR